MTLIQYAYKTIIGTMYFVASDEGLCGIYWKEQKCSRALKLDKKISSHALLIKAMAQIDEFLLGKRKTFDLPLVFKGTEFQMRVWKELQKIPYGKTISYKELAARINNPKAVRAVGTANGKNPLSLVIPCHRVIANNGTLGGYAGGLPAKTKLLELEAE